MKLRKLFALACGAAMALTLAACGGGEDAPAMGTGEAQVPDLDPAAVTQALLDSGAFSETLETLELDTAYQLYALEGYGVAREDILDGSVYLSAGATAEEASVLVLKDADTAATVLEALQAHVDLQKESYESYLPAEIPKLDNARLVTHGNSVVLVVPADSDAADTVVDKLSDYEAQ